MQLKSNRLVIRSYMYEDYEAWIAGLKNRLGSQSRHDEGRPQDLSAYTKEKFKKKIEQWSKQDDAWQLSEFGIFRENDGAHIGKIEMYRTQRNGKELVLLGYAIHNQYWRKGYGKESVVTIIPFIFEYLQPERIELHIDSDNLASIHLAESIGFNYEEKQSQFSFDSGEWSEFFIYYIEK